MKYNRSEGTISVFLALVILVLITFCCSIAEVTRLQIAQVQARRALQSAAQSVLAGYDSQLQSQYGLFARDFSDPLEIKEEILHYTTSGFPDASVNNPLLTSTSAFQPYQFDFNLLNITSQSSITNPEQFKNQILDYMTFRGPFQAIKPFVEKYELLSDAAKTSGILDKKEKMDEAIAEFESSYALLESLIEGFIITDGGNLKLENDGTPSLRAAYLKKVVTRDGYDLPVYSDKEIPDVNLRSRLNRNAWSVDRTLAIYADTLSRAKSALGETADCFLAIEELKEKKEGLKEERADIRDDIQGVAQASDQAAAWNAEIAAINREIGKINDQIGDLEKQMAYYGELYNMYHADLYIDYLPKLQTLGVLGAEGGEGYIDIHKQAVIQIETIRKQAQDLLETIEIFEADVKNTQMGQLDGMREEMNKTADRYKALLSEDMAVGESKMTTLNQMESTINNNLKTLQSIEPQIRILEEAEANLAEGWLDEIFSGKPEELKNEFKRTDNVENGMVLIQWNAGGHNPSKGTDMEAQVISSLENLEVQLDGYHRELYFDYGQMPMKLEDESMISKLMTIGKEMFPAIEIPENMMDIETGRLPSAGRGCEAAINPDTDTAGISHLLEGMAQYGASDLLGSLYLNEYAVGMFQNASEVGKNAVTLSQFEKSEHYLNYEVEYILMGKDNDYENVMAVVAILFSLRIVLNMIALFMDGEKMARLNELGAAVAGWWSMGIGGAVLVAGLMLLWSIVESVSDVQRLLAGESVPLVKTAATWETDILGNIWGEGAEAVAEELTGENNNKALNLIPEPDYADYMRMLLLSPMTDEETELYRMMDLIQMNLEKSRQKSVDLDSLVTAFEVKGDFKINPLFMKLPFMSPSSGIGEEAYHFEEEAQAAY